MNGFYTISYRTPPPIFDIDQAGLLTQDPEDHDNDIKKTTYSWVFAKIRVDSQTFQNNFYCPMLTLGTCLVWIGSVQILS